MSFVGKRSPPARSGCRSLVEVNQPRLERQRLNTYSKRVDSVQSNCFLHFNPSHRPTVKPAKVLKPKRTPVFTGNIYFRNHYYLKVENRKRKKKLENVFFCASFQILSILQGNKKGTSSEACCALESRCDRRQDDCE